MGAGFFQGRIIKIIDMRKFVISIFFIFLTLSPVAGMLLRGGAFFKERPFLTPAPDFTRGALLMRPFYRGIEKYLDDRNPLRGEFIRTKSWLDVRLFHTSPAPNVRIGLNGWLYFKPAMKSYLKNDCGRTRRAYTLARRLQRLELELRKAGKRLIFVVAPDKATIYPEYVGGVPEGNGCGKNFYDLLLLAMKRFPVEGFVRLDEALLKAKKDGLLYYRGGTHWNDRGAALAAGLILRKLSTEREYPRPPEVTFEDKRMLQEDSPMLGVSLYERAPFAREIEFGEEVSTTGIKPLPFFPGEWVLLRTKTEPSSKRPLLPKALVYRDSFMTAPLKFLEGSFREIYARWSHFFPEAKGADPRELRTAKIVIVEIVERDLPLLRIRLKVLAGMIDGAGKRKS